MFLLDIEGTTTAIAFVTERLFPYARAHLVEFLEREGRAPETPRFLALMDADSKDPELKDLQGRIWEDGYERGELAGDVFEDVPRAFKRWHGRGVPIAIYSSGSVLAQQLLFRTTPAGDLTKYISSYFDTAVGAKRDAGSYARIAERVGLAPDAITFVSDVVAELDAARSAGMHTLLSLRPGNPPQATNDHPAVATFDAVS